MQDDGITQRKPCHILVHAYITHVLRLVELDTPYYNTLGAAYREQTGTKKTPSHDSLANSKCQPGTLGCESNTFGVPVL